MLRANLLGPERPAAKDPEAVAYAFDGLRRQADATKVRPGTTLQWEFSDYEPWHVVLDPEDALPVERGGLREVRLAGQNRRARARQTRDLFGDV